MSRSSDRPLPDLLEPKPGALLRDAPDGSLSFRDAILFPQELADQLLAKMATEGKSGAKHAT